ncbi:hypothetical protein ACSSWA_04205 [Melioribacter sp. Ez-97]|uniref:hypothetical protein n=1 Tax=Melioribacter sp. Ez-97 TaxID=3423434 RepID=UPI003ED9B55D
MAKPLFKNYSYEFDKNEKKLLITFCKTIIKQMSTDDRFYNEIKTFNSLLQKLESDGNPVKLTKDEKTKLVFRLKENEKHLEKQIKSAGFIKKWIYKPLYKQYKNIIETHFND